MNKLLILLFNMLNFSALKTATLGLLLLIKVGDFSGEICLKYGRLLFVVGNFGIEFVEGFSAGCQD